MTIDVPTRSQAETFIAIEEIAKAIYAVSAEKISEAMSDPEGLYWHKAPSFWELQESEQELHREYARAAVRAIPSALGLGRV